jgi:hypothetical protein
MKNICPNLQDIQNFINFEVSRWLIYYFRMPDLLNTSGRI